MGFALSLTGAVAVRRTGFPVVDKAAGIVGDVCAAAGAAVGLAWQALLWVIDHALVLVLVVGAVWAVVAVARCLLTGRALRGREQVMIAAVDDWDPRAEEVRHYLAPMAGEHRHPLTGAARGRRLRLDSGPAERVLYSLEAAPDVISAVRSNAPRSVVQLERVEDVDLPGIGSISLSDPDDVEDDPEEGEDPALAGFTDLVDDEPAGEARAQADSRPGEEAGWQEDHEAEEPGA